jgi:farnesyl-diphosphate farnesyltransferase
VIQALTKTQSAYLADYMNKVSRSFSLVAPELERPMDDYLGVAYLICRVVDNIEDAERPFMWKHARFAEFEALLTAPEKAEAVLATWETQDWPGLSAHEQAMMTCAGGLMLWEVYAAMPELYRASIQHWASEMARGMRCSVDPSANDFFCDREGVRLPITAADYDRYCYYVAGTVGRMITEMMASFYGLDEATAVILGDDSERCGRGLQKTNIIKDFAKDLGRGFSYLPDEWLAQAAYRPLRLQGAAAEWKTAVLRDALAELDGAVAYVTGLPLEARGFRKAGLLMLLPAYDTLHLAAGRLPDLFTPEHQVKISRAKMSQALARTHRLAADNSGIRIYADEQSARTRAELARYE